MSVFLSRIFCHCRLETAIPLLQHVLVGLKEHSKEHIAIAFPDDGAFKRFSLMFQDYSTIICHKIRDENKRIVRVKDGL